MNLMVNFPFPVNSNLKQVNENHGTSRIPWSYARANKNAQRYLGVNCYSLLDFKLRKKVYI